MERLSVSAGVGAAEGNAQPLVPVDSRASPEKGDRSWCSAKFGQVEKSSRAFSARGMCGKFPRAARSGAGPWLPSAAPPALTDGLSIHVSEITLSCLILSVPLFVRERIACFGLRFQKCSFLSRYLLLKCPNSRTQAV